jgi:molecular chaperone GrpE
MSIKQSETRAEPQEKVPEPPLSESEAPVESVAGDSEFEPADEARPENGDSARVALLASELAAAREELSSVNDKYLRKLAEDVNFRKRMTREKEDGQRFAVATLLGDLIPILDDLDRAIASAEIQKDYAILHDGVLLIKRQLGSVLEAKYGLARFESLGKPFDPNHHEAVAMVQGGPEDGDEAVVAEEFLPGYGLHERILRTAKVRVRMPSPKAASSDAPADDSEAR